MPRWRRRRLQRQRRKDRGRSVPWWRISHTVRWWIESIRLEVLGAGVTVEDLD